MAKYTKEERMSRAELEENLDIPEEHWIEEVDVGFDNTMQEWLFSYTVNDGEVNDGE